MRPDDPESAVSSDEAPEALRRELHDLFRRDPVPAHVEAAVLAEARELLAPATTRRRFVPRRVLPWTTAAAAAALCVWIGVRSNRMPDVRDAASVERVALVHDVDGNGRVDVLDAFSIARHIEADAADAPAHWDYNGDGVVDDRDINLVVAEAVRIDA